MFKLCRELLALNRARGERGIARQVIDAFVLCAAQFCFGVLVCGKRLFPTSLRGFKQTVTVQDLSDTRLVLNFLRGRERRGIGTRRRVVLSV